MSAGVHIYILSSHRNSGIADADSGNTTQSLLFVWSWKLQGGQTWQFPWLNGLDVLGSSILISFTSLPNVYIAAKYLDRKRRKRRTRIDYARRGSIEKRIVIYHLHFWCTYICQKFIWTSGYSNSIYYFFSKQFRIIEGGFCSIVYQYCRRYNRLRISDTKTGRACANTTFPS